MKYFQLDECFNDKRLAETCNAEGRCIVRRFPRRRKEQKDPIVLPDLLTKDAPLLTTDFTIADDHRNAIPEWNSGLIVVRSRNSRKPFTSKSAGANLARLKHKFPSWAETDWSGIYLEVDEKAVFLSQLGRVQGGRWINFDRDDFSEAMATELGRFRDVPPKLQRD
jgi:hypothetical protein